MKMPCRCCGCRIESTLLPSEFRILNEDAIPTSDIEVGKFYITKDPTGYRLRALAEFLFNSTGSDSSEFVLRVYGGLSTEIELDNNGDPFETPSSYVMTQFTYQPSEHDGYHSFIHSQSVKTIAGDVFSPDDERYFVVPSQLGRPVRQLSLCYGPRSIDAIEDYGQAMQISDDPLVYVITLPSPSAPKRIYRFPKTENAFYTYSGSEEEFDIEGRFLLVEFDPGGYVYTFYDNLDEFETFERLESNGNTTSNVSAVPDDRPIPNGSYCGFELLSKTNISSLTFTSLTLNETSLFGKKVCQNCGGPFGCQDWVTVPPLTGFDDLPLPFFQALAESVVPGVIVTDARALDATESTSPAFSTHNIANSGACGTSVSVVVHYRVTVDYPPTDTIGATFEINISALLRFKGLPLEVELPNSLSAEYAGLGSPGVFAFEFGNVVVVGNEIQLESPWAALDGHVLNS